MGNTNVESRFADYRTYFYKGKEIDRQVHLGYDLASFQQAPVSGVEPRRRHATPRHWASTATASSLDHGLGVQSLYGHLSTMDVKEGDAVEKGQTLGQTGITGLAGGDHLHFTMLVDGVAVNPVEWWDPHWMEDRVFRKIREAGGKAPSAERMTIMRRRCVLRRFLCASVLVLAACGSASPTPAPAADAPPAVDPATAGSLSGQIAARRARRRPRT